MTKTFRALPVVSRVGSIMPLTSSSSGWDERRPTFLTTSVSD